MVQLLKSAVALLQSFVSAERLSASPAREAPPVQAVVIRPVASSLMRFALAFERR